MSAEEVKRLEKAIGDHPHAWNATMDTPQYAPLTLDKSVYEKNLPNGITPETVVALKEYDQNFREAFILAAGKMFIGDEDVNNKEWRETCPTESFVAQTTTEEITCVFGLNEDMSDITMEVDVSLPETTSPLLELRQLYKEKLAELSATDAVAEEELE